MNFKEIDIEKLKVSGNRLLIRTKSPEKNDGWEKRDSGIVVAAQTEVGKKEPDNITEVAGIGELNNMDIQKGVFIIHQPFTGFKFSNGLYDYTILSEQDVLAVL
ncbi:MAG: hypothetical protein KAT14_08580 [Candidatus Marinimicrobia bacterium]|nr:hypothetical protein [Candidatus Neomarinimicrobiota bacterium]